MLDNNLLKGEARLKEVIKMAYKLNWVYAIDQPNFRNFSYPLMQLSEIEKCMIALYDDNQFNRMVAWTKDIPEDYKPDNMIVRHLRIIPDNANAQRSRS